MNINWKAMVDSDVMLVKKLDFIVIASRGLKFDIPEYVTNITNTSLLILLRNFLAYNQSIILVYLSY